MLKEHKRSRQYTCSELLQASVCPYVWYKNVLMYSTCSLETMNMQIRTAWPEYFQVILYENFDIFFFQFQQFLSTQPCGDVIIKM